MNLFFRYLFKFFEMKIVLLGYMGCGKSTLGAFIANKLNLSHIDLDDYISQKEGLTIGEIFKQHGEIYFRRQESHYLKEILESNSDIVLSLGGGTPCYGNNSAMIHQATNLSFYIKLSIPSLVERLKFEQQKRPLIANLNHDQLSEFIGKHLFERAPFYEQAHIKLDANNKSISELFEALHTYVR